MMNFHRSHVLQKELLDNNSLIKLGEIHVSCHQGHFQPVKRENDDQHINKIVTCYEEGLTTY